MEARKQKRAARSGWMDNFNLRKSPPLWAIVEAGGTTEARDKGSRRFWGG